MRSFLKDLDPEWRTLYTKKDNLDLFPGTLTEYNDFKGAEHKIMDTGAPKKYVQVSHHLDDLIIQIINEGCKGLIHYNTSGHTGLPVKLKS